MEEESEKEVLSAYGYHICRLIAKVTRLISLRTCYAIHQKGRNDTTFKRARYVTVTNPAIIAVTALNKTLNVLRFTPYRVPTDRIGFAIFKSRRHSVSN